MKWYRRHIKTDGRTACKYGRDAGLTFGCREIGYAVGEGGRGVLNGEPTGPITAATKQSPDLGCNLTVPPSLPNPRPPILIKRPNTSLQALG